MDVKAHLEDLSSRQTRKRWAALQVAEKLRDVRQERHLTQRELAERVGITESAVRNYELMQASPSQAHLEALATALDIRVESLRLYDLGDQERALRALFQIGDVYGLKPGRCVIPAEVTGTGEDLERPCIRPTSVYMWELLRSWAYRYDGCLRGSISIDEYRIWQDSYAGEYELTDFPGRCETVAGVVRPVEPWLERCMASKIKAMRKRAGMSQAELAKAVGKSLPTVRTYEQAKNLPKEATIARLADALGVRESALVLLDLRTPVDAAHALFQLSDRRLWVSMVGGEPIIWPYRGGLEREIGYWAYIDELMEAGGHTSEWYQEMRDCYNEDDFNCGVDPDVLEIPEEVSYPPIRYVDNPFDDDQSRPKI